ncbi:MULTISPECIES: M23 family metallopeptidase [Clostridium]|uniref:M23 family metallopeptidase n=1 Tax=Clostridium TaxID=1485 RepID=UPI0006C63BD8|nr:MULTISPECIES: M23 family metallopeptidase [Clostridium]MBX9185082.1 M23 family metallopeptidase [Clostridium sp. K04]MDU3522056.1 M23 family metallopeptidase [Clostridium saudiense]CUO45103.1 peptidase M23B [Clostridium disporicum]
MDQNKKNKVKDFFRKEGFYLVLLVCLCVVATVAAFTIKKNSVAKEQNNTSNELSLNDVQDSNSSEVDSNFNMQNAERVENNDELAEANDNEISQEEVTNEADNDTNDTNEAIVSENQNNSEQEADVDVSAGTDSNIVLSLPIDGEVAISREFGKMVRTYSDETRSEDISRRGIDINAAVGTTVKAAAEGKVEEVSSNTTDGTYVVIAHANGLKTKYANLSEDVKVAAGDTVSAGTEIGTVGNSSGIFTSKICGDVLNVQVQDANGKDVDPSAYFEMK